MRLLQSAYIFPLFDSCKKTIVKCTSRTACKQRTHRSCTAHWAVIKKDLAGRRWLIWLPADRRVQLSLTECWGGVVVVYVWQISQFILPWIDPKILFTWLSGWRPESEGGAERWEQKSTFTGREIRGQRKRTNGRAGDVATPSHCCCCFDLPCRLCQISQQTHGQPQNSYFLHSILKSRYKGSRAVISLLENP